MPKGTNVGSVWFNITSNRGAFTKEMNKTASGVQSTWSAASSKVKTAIGTAFSVAAVVSFGKKCVQVASETQSAWMGLSSILNGQGKSFNQANKFIQQYISDGLVPLNNAVTAYKNLAARGYSTDQIEKTLTALKDAAAFGRQASYSYGDAIQTATEGLKNENSILVDNASVTKNVAKMWDDYAKSIGTTSNNLTQQQKIQAEVAGIIAETKWQTGDAAKYSDTFAGRIAKLSATFTSLKTTIGNVIIPILNLFLPAIQTALDALSRFLATLQSVMASLGLEMPDVSSLSNVTSSAIDAATAIDSTGTAAETAAKKAKKAFASFDEINVLSNSASSSSSSGAGVSSITTDASVNALNQTNNIDKQVNGKLDSLKKKLNDFWTGFSSGFETETKILKRNIDNLKKNFSDAWKDIKSLGTPIKNWTSTDLLSFFDSFSHSAITTFNGLFDSANTIFSDLWNVAVYPILSNFITEGLPLVSQFGTEAVGLWNSTFASVKTIFDSVWSEGIVPALGEVTTIWTDIMTILKEKWDKYGEPIFKGFSNGVINTRDLIIQAWQQYIKPVWDTVMAAVDEIWTYHLKPLVDNVIEFVSEFTLAAQNIYNNFISPIVLWLRDILAPTFTGAFEAIERFVTPIITGIIDTANGIITALKGIVQFISGVFSGDWSKAWEGIKTTFTGIWDTISSFIKRPLNQIIGLIESFVNGTISVINTMITGLNYAPGVDIKHLSKVYIPRLAQGGWVAANNPQLAIVGDNRREGEIITPESKIREQVEEALRKFGNSSAVQTVKLAIELIIKYPDGRTVIKQINEAQIAEGKILLEV